MRKENKELTSLSDLILIRNTHMHDVWSALFYAKISIADCTKRNPNVF